MKLFDLTDNSNDTGKSFYVLPYLSIHSGDGYKYLEMGWLKWMWQVEL